ncbi:MAG TPA: nitroreductase family deazaflavin-dependent oxidoreductase [Acidimicrobiia bacterium]|nr:nitroreductase family deazaflavin-dependent oxidoreductase [Acidimicrobiia bacterium]
MPIPKSVASFNRFVTNPLGRLVAGWAPGFAIIRHRGRKTGKTYSTPINIFKVEDRFVIALTYGSNADWLKNVFAAGGCTIKNRNKEIDLVGPTLVATSAGMSIMPLPVRVILRAANVTEFVELRKV